MNLATTILSALGGASALGCLIAAVAAYFKAKAAAIECKECRDELVKVRELVGDVNALRAESDAKDRRILQLQADVSNALAGNTAALSEGALSALLSKVQEPIDAFGFCTE